MRHYLIHLLLYFSSISVVFSQSYISSYHGKGNHIKNISLYEKLFADYDQLSKDDEKEKEKNKTVLTRILKIYKSEYTSFDIIDLKKELKKLQKPKDALVLSQLAFLYTQVDSNYEDYIHGRKLLENIDIEDGPYGVFVKYLLAKYKATAMHNTISFMGDKKWRDATRAHGDYLIKLLEKKPIDNFQFLYEHEIDSFFSWESKREFNHAINKKSLIKDELLKKTFDVISFTGNFYYHVKDKNKMSKELLTKLEELYKLNPQSHFALRQLIYLSKSKDEAAKWYEISRKTFPDYTVTFKYYFNKLPHSERVNFLIENSPLDTEFSSIHAECLLRFHFHILRKTDSSMEDAYMRHFHPLAKKMEASEAKLGNPVRFVRNRIHNYHYVLAKTLKKYSHIRKIHELYGDIIEIDRNDHGRVIPFSYAVTGAASGLVYKIDDRLKSYQNKMLSESDVKVFESILEDSKTARRLSNDERSNDYFNYVDKNCNLVLSFFKGEDTKLTFDKHLWAFFRPTKNNYFEVIDENNLIIRSSMQDNQYLCTYFQFPAPFEVSVKVSILDSKVKRLMAGITVGKQQTGYSGRMFLAFNEWKAGIARRGRSGAEIKRNILAKKVEGTGPVVMDLKVKVWKGASELYVNGKKFDIYLDHELVPGFIGIGTPAWISLGGKNKFSNLSIKKIDDPKPIEGYVPRFLKKPEEKK